MRPGVRGRCRREKGAKHLHIRRPHATSRSSSIIDGCFNRVIKYAELRDETVLIYIPVAGSSAAGFSHWDGGTCWIWAKRTESNGATGRLRRERTDSILWVWLSYERLVMTSKSVPMSRSSLFLTVTANNLSFLVASCVLLLGLLNKSHSSTEY